MTDLGSLPTVSAPAVLWALHRIAYTREEQDYSAKRLTAQGRPRNIGTLLRFLGLIAKNGRLSDDALPARGNPQAFHDLLLRRFKQTCVARGWWTEGLDGNFGRRALGDEELDQLLNSLPPVQRQSKAAKRNLLAGLRELHTFLLNALDRDWVEKRLLELQSRRSAGTRPAAIAPDAGNRDALDANVPDYDPHAHQVPRPAVADFDHLVRSNYGLRPEDMVRVEVFPLEFDANEEPSLVVEATFNPPLSTLTPPQLLRLANCIKRLAGAGTVAFARRSDVKPPAACRLALEGK